MAAAPVSIMAEIAGFISLGRRSAIQITFVFPLSAKRLLNETGLPVTAIAFRAGFKSLRRFNSAFREFYGRSPSKLRPRRAAA
ncbi:MAG: helix-turn-helix domain-containing protein [Xanthobacteraceae bacterium]|jgi:hypothetical protein|nr:helix-turn-helix domain-containing protein [Xanthobacteraceae bacterium]